MGTIRGDADIRQITGEIASINAIVGKVIEETQASGQAQLVEHLDDSRQRLNDASQHGQNMASSGVDTGDREWRMWTQTLPPIAFEIAREVKELVQRVDRLATGGADDFS